MRKFFKFVLRAGNINGKKPKEHQKIFRKLFLTAEGLEVIRVLLGDWCFFDACRNERDRAMNEYAKYFLSERLGLAGVNVYTELDPDFLDKLEKTNEEG